MLRVSFLCSHFSSILRIWDNLCRSVCDTLMRTRSILHKSRIGDFDIGHPVSSLPYQADHSNIKINKFHLNPEVPLLYFQTEYKKDCPTADD